MTLDDLRPGWRSEFMLHAHGGRVERRADCLVVRTPDNPHFYWGNFLLLPRAPRDDELLHWLSRFDAEITQPQPASQHLAFGINAPPRGEALPSWREAGFEVIATAVLEQRPGELRPPPRAPRGRTEVRPLNLAHELQAVVALQCADAQGYEPVAHAAFRYTQMQRYAAMATLGQAQWFGVYCEGVLAADCGLMRDATVPGANGRFQHVTTHPDWRRRGLCSALVHEVTRFAFARWQLARVLMCADPDDVAIGIYESLGYRRIDSEWGLQLRAPQDRAADGETADLAP